MAYKPKKKPKKAEPLEVDTLEHETDEEGKPEKVISEPPVPVIEEPIVFESDDPWENWLNEFSAYMGSVGQPTNERRLVKAGRSLYLALYTRTTEQRDILVPEVKEYEVPLDADPTSMGLASLNAKLSAIQGYKDRLTTALTTLIADLQNDWGRFEAEVEAASSRAFEIDIVSPRMADIGRQTKEQYTARSNAWHPQLVELKVFMADGARQSKWLVDILRERLKNLESTNSNASRQITVVQLMLETGEVRRGDRRPGPQE
jgi:hypothetical protein